MSKTSRQREMNRQSLFAASHTRRSVPDGSADTTKETVNKIGKILPYHPAGGRGLSVEATSTPTPLLTRLPEEWEVPEGQLSPREVRAMIRRNLRLVKHPVKRWFSGASRPA